MKRSSRALLTRPAVLREVDPVDGQVPLWSGMTSVPALVNGWQIPFLLSGPLGLYNILKAIIYSGPKRLTRFNGRTERVGNVSMLWQVSNNTWLVLMQQFFSHRTLRSEANPESPAAVVEKLSCSGMWKEGYKAGGLTKLIKPWSDGDMSIDWCDRALSAEYGHPQPGRKGYKSMARRNNQNFSS